jgi:hypothetical protein
MNSYTCLINCFVVLVLLILIGNLANCYSPDGTDGIKFTKSQQTLGNMRTFDVAIGDIDMDGDNDVFTTNWLGAGKLWINNGHGNFTQSSQNFGNARSHEVAIRDFNGDGYPDILVFNHIAPSKVYFNNGSGAFTASDQNIGTSTDEPDMVILGDVDNDGDIDFLLDYPDLPNRLWLNDGTGYFSPSDQQFGGVEGHHMALADVNGDGSLDLYLSRYNKPGEIWMNDGHGVFTNSGQSLGESAGYDYIESGDTDGDGDIDFAVSNTVSGIKIWLNQNNTGTFVEAGPYFGTASWRCKLFDADGDGNLDLLVPNKQEIPVIWVNDGKGHFDSAAVLVGCSKVTSMGCADLDGDDDLDIVLGQEEGSGGNSIYFNESTSGKTDSISVNNHSGWNMISIPTDSIYFKNDIFPLSITSAYFYDPDSADYVVKDTFETGKGYWLKFTSSGKTNLYAENVFADSLGIEVTSGWNMIGSISYTVPIATITSIPPGMITSDFFTYHSGYVVRDTIVPGIGYWVKVDQPGHLILSESGVSSSSQRIRIMHGDNTPPPPPFDALSVGKNSTPSRFVLHQNYPNPFNPTTIIRFDIPARSHVRLEVFNILGSLVKTLLDEGKDAGSYSITWDGTDNNGTLLPSELYFYRLRSRHLCQIQKALLIK